jgi:fatty acid desaturase
MARDVLHVVPQNEQWAVKKENTERADSTHDTQKEAIDAAREKASDGDSIVIHRADGTIRGRLMYTEDNDTTSKNGRESKPEVKVHDLMSVGKRVSWSALLAGVVVAIAVYATLMMLAVAIGVTTRERIADMPEQAAIVAAIIALVSAWAALFLGGMVASRVTVGEDKLEAIIYGVLLWGAVFVFSIIGGASMANTAVIGSGLWAQTEPAKEAYREGKQALKEAQNAPPGNAQPDTQKSETKKKLDEIQGATRETLDRLNPTAVAWLTFLAMILSICAAVGGAIVGAGPELVVQQLRDRRRLFVAARPASAPVVSAPVKART